MKAIEIRNKYLKFFESKGHKIITGAKLIPENDPTVLFTTAGMHPLVTYLVGASHPSGKRLVDFQKCLRTDDIDEVGDNRHVTFLEMLGNWSLGDYFKEDSIKYSFEFLTEVLNIPVEKISVTCFIGDNDAPKDEISAKIWEECGIDKSRIYFFGKKDNWWGPAGQTGPCGPDTEIFFDLGVPKCCDECNPSCDCGKYIEIWNNVFMEYNKMEDGNFKPLSQKNVDTGMGLERITFLMQGKNNIFETELFMPIISKIIELSKNPKELSLRIIADHLRASSMLICDSVMPSNVGQGYILRRLIRRAIRHMRKIEFNLDKISDVIVTIIDSLKDMYVELDDNRDIILEEIIREKNRFMNTLLSGEKEFIKVTNKLKEENINIIDGAATFRLYDTFGFPPEVTDELAKENGFCIDMDSFKVCYEQHQAKSREGSEGIFKGGLADHSEETTKYHTAAHLILESLQKILGDHVMQKGSNITAERIRFDFSHPEKVTRELLDQVENMVNDQIDKKLTVVCSEMSLDDARKFGAKGVFASKYGETVKVYTIEGFSKEICGGPHVDNTSKLEHIKILK